MLHHLLQKWNLLYTNNSNYRVSALVQGEKEDIHGLIEGYDVERNELILKRIDSSVKLEVGEKVIIIWA